MIDLENLDDRRLDLRLTLRLLGYLRPYGIWMLLTLVLITAAAVVQQAGPLLTKIAVDDYIIPGDGVGLGGVILVFAGLLILQFGIGYGQSWASSMVGQWAMRDLRQEIFGHLLRLPIRFFDRTPIGRLMAHNTSDVDALNEVFTDGFVSICSDAFTILTILAYIFYLDVELGLITCAALPTCFLAILWLQRKTFRADRLARTRFARFAAWLQEAISGMEVVQLFGCEERSVHRFAEGNDAYLQARLQRTLYHSLYFPSMELCGVGITALVIWHAGGQVIRSEIQWGVLVAMLQYVTRFFMPIRDIAERYSMLQMAMASCERIFELLDHAPESPGGDFRADRLRGKIEFRDVWFAYEGEDWVLRDVSFQAVPGQRLALVGTTGAGKSTVVSLVGRFYEAQRGDILVDGVDIRKWDVHALRRRIGIVQQDVFLFAGDIETNVSLGRASSAQVDQAITDANAADFIASLPDGLRQLVAERGVSFSAGQRQLLAFARALAAAPDILVLDEATANIDTATESAIQAGIDKLMHGRTSIAVAHRLSTIRSADQILVMHKGRIRERGRHDELILRQGIYYRLQALQL